MNPLKLSTPNYSLLENTVRNVNNAETEKVDIDVKGLINRVIEKISDALTKDNTKKEYSDYDAININKVGGFANDLDNVLSDFEFNYLNQYLQGKKLSDIFDENGNLKPIDANNFSYKLPWYLSWILNDDKIIKQINSKITGIHFDVNDTIKDCTIEELVARESGYTAIVLKDKNGNYLFCSSPTNPNSKKDLSAISYTLGDYLFDDTLAKYIPQLFFKEEGSSEDYLNSIGNSQTSEDDYYAQINDCYSLMKKYAKLAETNDVNLNLSGFSLGGGITTTTYGLLKIKDSELAKSVSSVTVYNPYLLYANSYNEFSPHLNYDSDNSFADNFKDFMFGFSLTGNPFAGLITMFGKNTNAGFNINGNSIINQLKNDEKVIIYSAESDIVSTLNDYYPRLKKRFVIVPAGDIQLEIKPTDINYSSALKDLFTGKGVNVGDEVNTIIDNSIHNIHELYSFIIAGKGNHGFGNIEDNIFDEQGNIIQDGEYQNINTLFAKLAGTKYNGKLNTKPDLPFLLSTILKDMLPVDLALNYQKYIFDYVNLGEINLSNFDFKSIINYICNNAGKFNEDDFIEIIADSFEKWLTSSNGKKFLNNLLATENNFLSFLIEYSVDEAEIQSELVKEIKKLLKKDENYELAVESVFLIINGDSQAGMDILLNDIIIPNLDDIAEDNYDLVFDTLDNAIVSYLKSNTDIWDWIIDVGDWAVLDPLLDDLNRLLKEHPSVLDDVIDSISENGFNILDILEIIEPIVNEREFSIGSLLKPFNHTDILGFDVEYKTLYTWLSTLKWAINKWG